MNAASRSCIELMHPDLTLQRLCSSFADHPVVHSGRQGKIRFPFGWCLLNAGTAELSISLWASGPEELALLEARLARKVKRFAGRELRWNEVARQASCD